MNDIEKAIRNINDLIEVWELEQADEEMQMIIYKIDIEVFKIAISALEKQINDEPCHYCNSIKIATPASPRHNYKYCPMCGRKRSEVEDENN